MAARPAPPLKVFISYSHKDDERRERFLVHLSQLKRQGLIDPWQDRRITAGGDWAGAIDEHLNSAHLTILLVSADFLASDYCNDVEMTRALERSHNGKTRLVPVILAPCDWQTSRFAGFQALPTDGKPVVDWKTPDHGFADVVKGLRRLIVELCGPAPVHAQVLQTAVRRHPVRWIAGIFLAILLAAVSWLWSSGQRYLKQGTDLLNVGRYAEARLPLAQARRLNPFSAAAGCALEAVALDAVRSDRVQFEQRLGEARREYPRCAYLEVLAGDQKYDLGDRTGALAEYQTAAGHEPKLAEAYFDIGRLLDLDSKPDSALEQYQTAVRLSPGTPRYRNNLADLYFRREEYDKAIEEYGWIDRFPLAALESAKIYRLQGKLEDARERELDAIRWLQDPQVKSAEAQNAWAFDVNAGEQNQLRLIEEKECYAELELAVTAFLQSGDNAALNAIPAALNRCRSRQQELKSILNWELRRIATQTPALKPRTDEIVTRFLQSGV
jgi:tetratricopeptide (TPR) repeat protein